MMHRPPPWLTDRRCARVTWLLGNARALLDDTGGTLTAGDERCGPLFLVRAAQVLGHQVRKGDVVVVSPAEQ